MTPEALHAYLTRYHFSQDVVQRVIETYLIHEPRGTIQNPQAWSYVVATRATIQEQRSARQLSRGGGMYQRGGEEDGRELVDLTTNHLVDSLTPERYAISRQELSQTLTIPPSHRPLQRGRPRGGGWKAWQEDYQALQRDTH